MQDSYISTRKDLGIALEGSERTTMTALGGFLGEAIRAFDYTRIGELLRFGVTGLLCLIVNLLGVTLLTELAGVHYLSSLTISSTTSATVGFAINRWWTFRVRGTSIPPEYLRYLISAGTQIVISVWSCEYLVNHLGVPYLTAVVVVSGLLAPLSFLAHRTWSFGLAWLAKSPSNSMWSGDQGARAEKEA